MWSHINTACPEKGTEATFQGPEGALLSSVCFDSGPHPPITVFLWLCSTLLSAPPPLLSALTWPDSLSLCWLVARMVQMACCVGGILAA